VRQQLSNNPRRLWHLMILALPLWGAAGIGGVAWVLSRPLPDSDMPEVASNQGQDGQETRQQLALRDYRPIWNRSLRQRVVQEEEKEEEEQDSGSNSTDTSPGTEPDSDKGLLQILIEFIKSAVK